MSSSNLTVTAYVALGANLGDPLGQVEAAVTTLDQLPATRLLGRSPWYRSRPLGPKDQPDYLNGVVALSTGLGPFVLLDQLQAIERAHGRDRSVHWGPRTLDLDLLLYGQLSLDDPRLRLPHPEMCRRNFVIVPLFQIVPELQLPGGQRLSELVEELGEDGLVRW